MKLLRGHPNIVKLKNIMRPKDPKEFTNLNIVLEYCHSNLSGFLKTN